MDIQCISSGSKGNAYRITDGHSTLLLDCGVSFKKIQVACNFNTQFDGCLITHEHQDHCKGAKELLRRGIDVYATEGTLSAMNINGLVIHTEHTYDIGTFEVIAFDIEHDATEAVGFLIYSTATNEKLLYLTDTCYCRYTFSDLNYIMIECNHDKEMLIDNVLNKNIYPDLAKRILKSHMSLDTCIEFLKANNLSKVKEIYLIHLSNENSNANTFKTEIQKVTGKLVRVF